MHCQVLLSVYYTQGLVPGVEGTEDRLKEKKFMSLCPLKWFTVQGRNLYKSDYKTSQTGDRKKEEFEESLQSRRCLDCWKRESRVLLGGKIWKGRSGWKEHYRAR